MKIFEEPDKIMNQFEKSACVGYYRQGASFQTIGFIMSISPTYAEQIINEYLKTKK